MSLFEQHVEHLIKTTTEALEATGYDGLWIYSGHPVNNFLDDMAPPHSINPHFKWWVPVPHVTSSVLHFTPGERPLVYLHQPADFWHKIIDNSQDKWARHFEVRVIGHYSELPDFNAHRNHAWIGPEELQPLAEKDTNPEALLHHLHFARVQKTDYEIHCIGQANQIALRGHAAAKGAFYDGLSEFEINMAYLAACQQDQNQMPYGNIVALNENPAVLHYQYQSHARIEQAQLKSFLIDAGANYKGYAADITRTYAHKPGVFADMIEAMEVKQQDLCQQAVAGTSYVDLHVRAHHDICEVLKSFNVISCSPQTAVESGLSQTFFPHGLGHYLGLQVHDVAGHISDQTGTPNPPPEHHPFLRLTDQLRERAVITVEPGVYFIPMLLSQIKGHGDVNWDVIEGLLPYGGIRIEDNLVIGQGQSTNLSRPE